MKKLLFVSLVFLGMLSLASCKKTLAPSAITVDNTVARVTVMGTVTFQFASATAPGTSDNTVVTATVTWKEGAKDVTGTFSARPNDGGLYAIAIPLRFNADKVTVSKVEAVVEIPVGVFKGKLSGEAFSVNKNAVATGKDILCTKEE